MTDGDLDALVAAVRTAAPTGRRALVGIDGVGGSGKTTFADELSRHLGERPVLVLHIDDFFAPSAVRHARGRHSPEGFWLDAYDYGSLISCTLEHLGADGDGWYRSGSYDREADRTVLLEPVLAPPDALVLVEGAFLHRDELAAFWDFSIYLDVPFDETERRMAHRDGVPAGTVHELMRRYTEAQRIYFAVARPWERASVVVDNSDPARPRIIDPDVAAAAR